MRSDLDFKRDVVPFLIATVGEFVALVLWLHFLDLGNATAANAWLWGGFMIERLAVAYWVRFIWTPSGGGGAPAPLWATGVFLLAITLAEVGIWDVWLQSAGVQGHVIAMLLLLVLIHLLHGFEMGAVRKENPLRYLVNSRTLTYSIMEAVGAAGWLWLVREGQPLLGMAVLLIGLSVEHLVQGAQLKPAIVPAPSLARQRA